MGASTSYTTIHLIFMVVIGENYCFPDEKLGNSVFHIWIEMDIAYAITHWKIFLFNSMFLE
jgi:hypothetical protein